VPVPASAGVTLIATAHGNEVSARSFAATASGVADKATITSTELSYKKMSSKK
jgi:stage III sporulation protein SpoIIIAA